MLLGDTFRPTELRRRAPALLDSLDFVFPAHGRIVPKVGASASCRAKKAANGRLEALRVLARRDGTVQVVGVMRQQSQGLTIGVTLLACALTARAQAESRVLEFRFIPAHNAQIALWLEDGDGNFKATVALTEAVSRRGIGNRPGASQMNSGFRWPYGRREGVLPVWAHRRVSAPGARPFRRVIFQDRTAEGHSSRSSNDHSRDDYFCLSFTTSKSQKDALDAVSCASPFSSDKGRFITEADVRAGYAEPYEDVMTKQGRMLQLSFDSLYPPRRDAKRCVAEFTCYDHPDVDSYEAHALAVMPELDEVSMATPRGEAPQQRLFAAPDDWPQGEYRACLEINVEGDYNSVYDPKHYPTPQQPAVAWDDWSLAYGYPYRGQPSVVYCTPFELQVVREAAYHTSSVAGSVASWDTAAPSFGALSSAATMTDDPVTAPGSGGDRLRRNANGERLVVLVKSPQLCGGNAAPSGVQNLRLSQYPQRTEAHEWAELEFDAASDDQGIFRYEVRVSMDPIVDDASFMRGQPARSASRAAEELRVPTDLPSGSKIRVGVGGLVAETRYYVGVRAIDGCADVGPLSVAEFTTPVREFTTVTPCFVATAAYGSPLAGEISVLRRWRDRQLSNTLPGRMFVSAYGWLGPKLAEMIRGSEELRAGSRAMLAPWVHALKAKHLDQ